MATQSHFGFLAKTVLIDQNGLHFGRLGLFARAFFAKNTLGPYLEVFYVKLVWKVVWEAGLAPENLLIFGGA